MYPVKSFTFIDHEASKYSTCYQKRKVINHQRQPDINCATNNRDQPERYTRATVQQWHNFYKSNQLLFFNQILRPIT